MANRAITGFKLAAYFGQAHKSERNRGCTVAGQEKKERVSAISGEPGKFRLSLLFLYHF